MKKNLLFVAVVALSMASCKKDRTCTCNVTQVSSTLNGVTQPVQSGTRTREYKITKVTKKGAACNSGEETTTSTSTSNNVVSTQVVVAKAECTLK
jgi:hypothetical protein